jgi:hypothetical protein
MPGNDPAHVQQRGESSKIASTLREIRLRIASAGGRHKRKARLKLARAR